MQRRIAGSIDLRGLAFLGGLVLVCLGIAFSGSVIAIRQLDAAEASQIRLSDAQSNLDAALRAQLDEETGLRGYIATRQRNFVEPYTSGVDAFDEPVDLLTHDLQSQRLTDALPLLDDMRRAHAQWDHDVALPLIDPRSASDLVSRETIGKLLTDRLRADANELRGRLREERDAVENHLRREINATVGVSALLVAACAISAIFFGFGRSLAVARLARQSSIVAALQRNLRAEHAALSGTRIGTSYVSATLDAQVGGDLFDVWNLPGGRDFVLSADFSGKGVGAAVNVAFVQFAIRTLSLELDDPADILARFNRLFAAMIADPTLFVVVFLGRYDTASRTLTFASAGHGSAYVRRGRTVDVLPVTGPIVGLGDGDGYESRKLVLAEGDTVVLATDGLTESRDRHGEILGDAEAMRLIADGPVDPQELCDRLVAEVSTRAQGTIKDDLALLAIHILGGARPAGA